MSALQKILVPVDFSEESANDLKYAVRWPRKRKLNS